MVKITENGIIYIVSSATEINIATSTIKTQCSRCGALLKDNQMNVFVPCMEESFCPECGAVEIQALQGATQEKILEMGSLKAQRESNWINRFRE